jgi:A/G-specific adenine glycosylase
MTAAEADPGARATMRRALLQWYAVARRDFPWRRTRDPYAVLVSEVMLQQTQASRVAERFPRFLERFPTAAALAETPQAAVLAEWNGLGYNRRALALQRCAAIVVRDGWPRSVEGLQRLPGIGAYTARAIASLAFAEPVGVVDTNVRRWLLRRFAIEDRPAALQALADRLAAAGRHPDEVAAWTHATMELGASVCTARSPRCEACPIADGCPSRHAAPLVPVPRQAAYPGSSRARRGTLLRELSAAPDHALRDDEARRLLSDDRFETTVAGLERDGLLHRSGQWLRLGGSPEPPPEPQAAAATIGR